MVWDWSVLGSAFEKETEELVGEGNMSGAFSVFGVAAVCISREHWIRSLGVAGKQIWILSFSLL